MQQNNVYSYRAKVKKRKISKSFIALLIVFIFLALLGYYMASPLAKIGTIKVSGNSRLRTDEILMIAGLESGMHLWQFPLGSCKDKLSGNPWIKKCMVNWRFPNTVLVTVVERQGVAIVKTSEGNWVIAEDMVVLAQSDGFSLPWLTGLNPESIALGLELEGENCEVALTWLTAFQPIASQISEISFQEYPILISVYTNDGYKALFNSYTSPEERLEDCALLLEELRRTGQKGIIDLRGYRGRGIFIPWPDKSTGN